MKLCNELQKLDNNKKINRKNLKIIQFEIMTHLRDIKDIFLIIYLKKIKNILKSIVKVL